MFTDLYESLADIIQSWKESTQNIVFIVLVAFTFFAFSKAMIGLKGDPKKISNWKQIIILLICIALLFLYMNIMRY